MKLAGLLVLIAVSASSSLAQTPPPQATTAGYTHLVFDDEFNSPNTISPDGTGNYNWYAKNIYGPPSLPSTGYSVQNGYLEINTDVRATAMVCPR